MMARMSFVPGRWILAAWAVVSVGEMACATARTTCPLGTGLTRRVYSGGAESEWCRRPDGVRDGPETRYYESGVELATGAYVDGAVSGVWRYRFNDGRNWRADRWEDGVLVDKTIDPAVAKLSPGELERLGTTSSGIIKLASADPLLGRASREGAGRTFVGAHPNGRVRVAGAYDADGLRTGVWRFWDADGHPQQEVEYLAGVRERATRSWHPNGKPAVEGFYLAGQRDGRWRWWDDAGRPTAEISYDAGRKVGGGVMVGP
jgi:antitoxin component YwqK of YwqJK toxin-antitoxin module